ncbi:MAG: hypothetical protein ACRD5K_00555 [Candidatus Acidiferrales bacterium]
MSVEKPKGDPFTIADGRHVGHDGFVVPKDFGEFYERFPRYVRRWVGRHVDRSTNQDVEDWTQELLIHLSCLPANSKHRQAGKWDVVQTFDPHKHYRANSARFFNYINLCLGNRFKTMHSARMKNQICRPGNLSLSIRSDDIDRDHAEDEFWRAHSEYLRGKCMEEERQCDVKHVLAEFSEFVGREDSSVLPAMGAISSIAALGDAAELLGATRADFFHKRSRLACWAGDSRRVIGYRDGEEQTADSLNQLRCPLVPTRMGIEFYEAQLCKFF